MKKTVILIASLGILLLVLIIFLFVPKKTSPQTNEIPTPTVFQQSSTTTAPLSVPEVPGSNKKMLDKIANKTTLSEADISAKNKIIARMGTSYQLSATDYTIYYIKLDDVFQAEILSQKIDIAKQEVVAWFESQGLSDAAICNIPVVFYLSPQARQKAATTGEKLSPLANGC